MTPMEKIFALFVDPVDSGWGRPIIALFRIVDPLNDWAGYHLWMGYKIRRHFQVWPVNKRFLKTWP